MVTERESERNGEIIRVFATGRAGKHPNKIQIDHDYFSIIIKEKNNKYINVIFSFKCVLFEIRRT